MNRNQNHDDEYDVEAEARLSGLASMIARGHTPEVIAQGWFDLLSTTGEQHRGRRKELARILHGVFQRVGESDHPDAERCRNLAAKLKEIWDS